MIAGLVKSYNKCPLSSRVISAFLYGAMFGLFIWGIEYEFDLPLTLSESTAFWLEPLGIILIGLLKLLIVPYVFFTLARAASRLSSDCFVKITWRMIFWFIVTSLIAAMVGTVAALIIGPGKGSMSLDVKALPLQYASELRGVSRLIPDNPTLSTLLVKVFSSPLSSAYAGGYLALAVFGLFFGLAMNASGSGRVSAFGDNVSSEKNTEYINASQLFRQGRKLDEIIKLLQVAINKSPGLADAYRLLGAALIAQEDYLNAAVYLNQAIQLDSCRAEIKTNLAVAYSKLGFKYLAAGAALDSLTSEGSTEWSNKKALEIWNKQYE
jgi:tetratricopeptide (TPR) repeat protein